MLGATGAAEIAFTTNPVCPEGCEASSRRVNLETVDPLCDLDYIPGAARSVQVEYALSNAFDFDGTGPPDRPEERAARLEGLWC